MENKTSLETCYSSGSCTEAKHMYNFTQPLYKNCPSSLTNWIATMWRNLHEEGNNLEQIELLIQRDFALSKEALVCWKTQNAIWLQSL